MSTRTIRTRRGKEILVDEGDYAYLSQFKWEVIHNDYARRTGRKAFNEPPSVLMHREILNAGKGEKIDHINRIRTDNRRCNLRFASDELNARNRNRNKNNTSGRPGIRPHGDRWTAFISVGPRGESKQVHLGVFDTFAEAVASRVTAERLLWGEEWQETPELSPAVTTAWQSPVWGEQNT